MKDNKKFSCQVREIEGAPVAPRFLLVLLTGLCFTFLAFPGLAETRNPAVVTAELIMQMEQLQQEVATLRNRVEQQERTLGRMQEEQRNRYVDLDERAQEHSRRLNQLEEARPVSTPRSPTQQPVNNNLPSAPQTSDVPPAQGNGNAAGADRDDYARAYELVPARRFDEAVTAFQNFIRKHPESRLVGNAYYWIGEIYMAQNRTQDAEKMFDAVVRRYSDSFKIADSKYKLGLIYARYGDERKARETMEGIVRDHPREPAADLARAYLQR